MSFEPDNQAVDAEQTDILELILRELRVISTLLGQGQNENVESIREGMNDAD